MSAKYFCDKCGKEVEEHEHYHLFFKNESNWNEDLKNYVNEDIYLCEEHREAIIVLMKAFLEQLLKPDVNVVFTRSVVKIERK